MNPLVPILKSVLRLNPSRATPHASSLHDLPDGARARVVAIELPAPARRRLMELGFLPGTPLHAVRRAPLGDPMQVELRGYHLSLRAREAGGIRVAREDS